MEISLNDLSFIEPVKDRLQLVEERLHNQAKGYHPAMEAALEHLLSSGGKRIRPILTLLTGGMLGTDPERLVPMAAAIEMLHTATLVHDDLIDGSLVRRGIPTLNTKWSSAATVLTGDFLFARAAKLAAETESVTALHLFAQTLAVIVDGEITQMFGDRGRANRSDYNRRIYAKTASLFETSTTATAIIANSDDAIKEKVRQYGYEIGMAFQIVDDILDFTSQTEKLGKPVASDLRQGLITLPALYYIESYPDDQDMITVIENDPCDESCLKRLLSAIRASGSIEKAMDEADSHVACAIDALAGLPDCTERTSLIELALYIVRRNV
jgi:geranylgeranyl pyrophosphate synthase